MKSEFEGDGSSTENLLAHIVARDVAYGVEMARSIGHKMPVEYDVGYSKVIERRLPRGAEVRIKLRMNDARYDVMVFMPYLDDRNTLTEIDQKWRTMMDALRSASLTLAQIWLDKHRDATVSGDQVKAALAHLDKIMSDDKTEAEWAEQCRLKAQALRYKAIGQASVVRS